MLQHIQLSQLNKECSRLYDVHVHYCQILTFSCNKCQSLYECLMHEDYEEDKASEPEPY